MVNLNCHQTDDERKECEGMRAERRDARVPAAWRRHRPRYAGCALRESIFAVLGLCGHCLLYTSDAEVTDGQRPCLPLKTVCTRRNGVAPEIL